jgi:hypothetical protein
MGSDMYFSCAVPNFADIDHGAAYFTAKPMGDGELVLPLNREHGERLVETGKSVCYT